MKALLLIIALTLPVTATAGALDSMLNNVDSVQSEQREQSFKDRMKARAEAEAKQRVKDAAIKAIRDKREADAKIHHDDQMAYEKKLKAMQLRSLEAELSVKEARATSLISKSDTIVNSEIKAYDAVTDIDKATAYTVKKVGDAAVIKAGQKTELHINKF